MSIAIIFQHKEIGDWFKNLNDLLPETKIEIYPEIENYDDVEFLVTWRPHENYISEFKNLKVVQSVGAGIDHLLHTPTPDDVVISRIVDPTLKQDLCEHVMACVLSSMKNFIPYYNHQMERQWQPQNYLSIATTTVTILGLGEIGKHVAEQFVRLGFQVKGWSNSAKTITGVQSFVGLEELAEAVSGSDFVVNILPLTDQTKGILNQDLFRHFMPSTTLINVGRGGHLAENDLVEALDHGQLRAAFLDVFQLEPLPEEHLFWNHSKIYITPHVASITNPETAILQVVDNYKRLKNKQELLHLVDLKRGY